VKIGNEHLADKLSLEAVQRIADIMISEGSAAGDEGLIIPSPAEFIDTLRAVHELYGANAEKAEIAAVIGIAVRKSSLRGGV
jgi:hypothetical protein